MISRDSASRGKPHITKDPGASLSVIVPTLNEADHIGTLLDSLDAQSVPPLEVIVVDGGSVDATHEVARERGARVLVCPGVREFPSRNLGASAARGDVLLFTGADVRFGHRVLERIGARFERDAALVGIGGPGIPSSPPALLGVEYAIYNFIRWAFATLPRPLKRFTSSTNLLAVRRDVFEALGGFDNEINADGRFGARLCAAGKVHFSCFRITCRISSRRLWSMGFIGFNRHFLYVLENFFPALSGSSMIERRKAWSARAHPSLRKAGRSSSLSGTIAASERGGREDVGDPISGRASPPSGAADMGDSSSGSPT